MKKLSLFTRRRRGVNYYQELVFQNFNNLKNNYDFSDTFLRQLKAKTRLPKKKKETFNAGCTWVLLKMKMLAKD